MLTAIETSGTISSGHQIELDQALPENAPERVRVIVLFDENGADIDDSEWLNSVSKNTAFDFLRDESEDIYTLADGKPVNDEE
jgi:hypothetical protein